MGTIEKGIEKQNNTSLKTDLRSLKQELTSSPTFALVSPPIIVRLKGYGCCWGGGSEGKGVKLTCQINWRSDQF